MPKRFVTYLIMAGNGFLYTGSTGNLRRRLREHGAEMKLIHHERFSKREEALLREKQIKGWSRAKKLALANGNLKNLNELSKRRAGKPAYKTSWALALCLTLPVLSFSKPTHELSIRVAQLECARTPRGQVEDVLKLASKTLSKACGLRLRYRGYSEIKSDDPDLCYLPADKKRRIAAVQSFSLPFRKNREKELSLFILYRTGDARMAWSHFDKRAQNGCGWPGDADARYLRPLASIFLTDAAFSAGDRSASLYLAHELVHTLIHQGHPTHLPPGNLMTDHTADIGEKIRPEQCDCLKQSPWVRIIKGQG